MIYGILIVLFFAINFITLNHSKLRIELYLVTLITLFVFSAFRYKVGCDWYGYSVQYSLYGLSVENREPLWWLLVGGTKVMGLPYPILNLVTSLLFFGGLHKLAQRQKDPIAFLIITLPVLVINMPMSGIRQAAAIGLVCVAFVSIIDRKPWSFMIWTILAACFHASAIVFLMFLPLAYKRISVAQCLLMLAGLTLCTFAFLSSPLLQMAQNRYASGSADANGAIFRISFLFLTSLVFLIFLRRKWREIYPEDYYLVLTSSVIILALLISLPVSTVIPDRFGYYFIPVQAIIFARIPYLNLHKFVTLYFLLPYIGLLMYFFGWSLLSYHFTACYLPYNSWLLGFPNGDPIGY